MFTIELTVEENKLFELSIEKTNRQCVHHFAEFVRLSPLHVDPTTERCSQGQL